MRRTRLHPHAAPGELFAARVGLAAACTFALAIILLSAPGAIALDPDPKVLEAERTLRSAELRPSSDAVALEMYRRASDLAEQALRVNPNSAGANFVFFAAQGRILLADGLTKNLFTLRGLDRDYLDRAIALNPRYANALAAKGGVLLDLPSMLGGDVDEALVLLRRANELNPGGTGMRVSLAKALYRKGRVEDAKRELRRAAHMSCIQGRKKALDDALALMEEIDPTLAKADSR